MAEATLAEEAQINKKKSYLVNYDVDIGEILEKAISNELSDEQKELLGQESCNATVFGAMIKSDCLQANNIGKYMRIAMEEQSFDLERWAKQVPGEIKIWDENFEEMVPVYMERSVGNPKTEKPKPSATEKEKYEYNLRCQTHLKKKILKTIQEFYERTENYNIDDLRKTFPEVLIFDTWSSDGLPKCGKKAVKFDSKVDQLTRMVLEPVKASTPRFKKSQLNLTQDGQAILDDNYSNLSEYDNELLFMTSLVNPNPIKKKDIEVPPSPVVPRAPPRKRPEECVQEEIEEFIYGKMNEMDLSKVANGDLAGHEKEVAKVLSVLATAFNHTSFKAGSRGHSRASTPSRPVTPVRSFKIRDFDYNMFGESCGAILGPIFNNTKFDSKQDRTAMAKEILNLVMSNPGTPMKTKRICTESLRDMTLGDFAPTVDVGRAFGSRSDPSFAMNVTTGDIDALPNHVIKSAHAQLGHKKFDYTPDVEELNMYLDVISRLIQDNGLSSSAGIRLLLLTSDNNLRRIVSMRKDEGLSMSKMFEEIRQIYGLRGGGEELQRELDLMVKTKPLVNDVAIHLENICYLCKKVYEGERDPDKKKKYTEDLCMKKMKETMRIHFKWYDNAIEDIFNMEKRMQEEREMFGMGNDQAPFNDVKCYKEIAVRYLRTKIDRMDRSRAQIAEAELNKSSKKREQNQPQQAEVMVLVSNGYQQQPNVKAPVQDANQGGAKQRQGQNQTMNQGNYRGKNFNPNYQQQRAQQGNMQVQQPKQYVQQPQNQQQFIQQVQQPQNVQPFVQQYQQPVQQQVQAPVIKFCPLCNMKNHNSSECFKYGGTPQGNVRCPACGGFHTVECKKLRNQARSVQGALISSPNQGYQNFNQNRQPGGYVQQGYQNQPPPQQYQDGRIGNDGHQVRPAGVGPNSDRHKAF